ncbi:MAG: hypothetical protein HJJLKODD_02924 [Phycisphaerae bacterium]|nr:hypothetical protein [Phycisphaerae bacterium]
MLFFHVFEGGQPVSKLPLTGAHLIGTDHVAIRAEFEFKSGELVCHKRAQGPAALCMLWPVKGLGAVLLETTRLIERDRPYNLHLELARGLLMRIAQKREDWGLFDIDNIDVMVRSCQKAQEIFIEALKSSNVAAAANLADEVLSIALPLSEQMALFHAGVFLNRRRQAGQFTPQLFGCRINPDNQQELYRKRLAAGFDFVTVPTCWRLLEPRPGENNWEALDNWVDWLTQYRLPIRMGPLVSFHELDIPGWVVQQELDYEQIRDFTYNYIRNVVQRYADRVQQWDAISGMHAFNTLNFNFEQLIDITRMASAVTKQLAPQAEVMVNITAPWGEYYARNPRTIPPLLYADMIVQNGINFDTLGLQMFMGLPVEGLFIRDMFQISTLLDRFASLGKPLHISAIQVPSNNTTDIYDAWSGKYSPAGAGQWYEPWSEMLQQRWLREFYNVALSKPFVESICWHSLADDEWRYLAHGGLLRSDLNPKIAFEQHCIIRNQIHGQRV